MNTNIKMCSRNSTGTLYTMLSCVIFFLSVLTTVHSVPLDNYPHHSPVLSSSKSHRRTHKDISGIYDEFLDNTHHEGGGDDGTTTRVHRNFYWWQVERKSGIKEIDTLERQKRFPRIVSSRVDIIFNLSTYLILKSPNYFFF